MNTMAELIDAKRNALRYARNAIGQAFQNYVLDSASHGYVNSVPLFRFIEEYKEKALALLDSVPDDAEGLEALRHDESLEQQIASRRVT